MIMEDNNGECFALFCSCGCDKGVLLKVDKEDERFPTYEISLVSDMYYVSQESSWWKRFKEKCKRIWKIIRNKEHEYFNIFIEKDEIEQFKDFVSKL